MPEYRYYCNECGCDLADASGAVPSLEYDARYGAGENCGRCDYHYYEPCDHDWETDGSIWMSHSPGTGLDDDGNTTYHDICKKCMMGRATV